MPHFLPDSVTLPKSRMATYWPSAQHYQIQPKLSTGARLKHDEEIMSGYGESDDDEKGFHHVDYYYFFDSVKCSVREFSFRENISSRRRRFTTFQPISFLEELSNRNYITKTIHENVDSDGNPMIPRMWLWNVLRSAPWSTSTSFLHIGCYTGYLNFVAAFSMGPNKVNHGLEADYQSFLRCRRRANEINTCFPKLREKISFPRFFNCHYSELRAHRRYSFIVCSCETTMEDRNAIINSLLEPGGELVTLRERTREITRAMKGNASYHVPIVHGGRVQTLKVRRFQEPTKRIVDLMEVPFLFELSASAVSEAIMTQISIEDEDCNCIIANFSLAFSSQIQDVERVREEIDRVHELLDRLCLPSTSDDETKSIINVTTLKTLPMWKYTFRNDIMLGVRGYEIPRSLQSLTSRFASTSIFNPRGHNPSEFKSRSKTLLQAMVDRLSPDFQNRWDKYVSAVKKLEGIPKSLQKYLYEEIDLTRIST